jgi:anti-sigma factor RsiW
MSDWLEIHALADGELTGEEQARVQERLGRCEKSQAEYAAVKNLKATLDSKCASVTCEETWQKCRKRMNELDKARRTENFVTKYAWGICSMFFVLILGAAMLNRTAGPGLRAMDVARMSAGMMTVPGPKSQNMPDKQRWVQETLQARVPVAETPLYVKSGAKGVTQDGRQVVRLDLLDDRGDLSLIVVERAQKVDDFTRVQGNSNYLGGSINGMNCVTWSDGGSAFLLVGDRSLPELCSVADVVSSR